jgi:hypothetical protein
MQTDLSDDAKKQIRSFAIRSIKTCASPTIQLIDGNSKPRIVGRTFRWETKTGKPVYYPNAYKRAWGKPIYIASTRRIQVGKQWVELLETDLLQLKMSCGRSLVHRELVKFNRNFC